jgi:membrane associated rhomboid family serine protease
MGVSVPAPMYCYRHPKRETGLSSSVCGRPICVECMTQAPVGIRCPEHSGSGQPMRTGRGLTSAMRPSSGSPLTIALVAVNVVVFLVELGQGGGAWNAGGTVVIRGALYGPAVANGDWWRLVTSAFLHANFIHLAMNMLALWLFGSQLERYVGSLRFGLIYLVSGLAGSAGALIAAPNSLTLGASGAIFGLLGAFVTLEYLQTGRIGGPALTLLIVNLAFTFAVPGISYGGHIGGLVGGVLTTLALARFGKGHAAYGRLDALGVLSVFAIGALSVVVSYWTIGAL